MNMQARHDPGRILSTAQKKHFIDEGYVTVSGLIPAASIDSARDVLWAGIGGEPNDSSTWDQGAADATYSLHAEMAPCRTSELEQAAGELVGPTFLRGACYSPFLEWKKSGQVMTPGFIPVLRLPFDGPREWLPHNSSFHLDGMQTVTLWPSGLYLIVLVYLSDTDWYGGATAVRPGSHRQIFKHWITRGQEPAPDETLADLPYADPIPVGGKAGDVVFMHYLLAHSGSHNRSGHIRFALNTGIQPDPARPYAQRSGSPRDDWTPLDWTLRTDDCERMIAHG